MNKRIAPSLCMLLAPLLLVACGELKSDMPDGIYQCTSNAGKPTLEFDSRELKIQRVGFDTIFFQFTDLISGQKHQIHSVEDRDYDCGTKIRDIPEIERGPTG